MRGEVGWAIKFGVRGCVVSEEGSSKEVSSEEGSSKEA
jgi:hypothetical protein